MLNLVGFELKKILSRKATLFTVIGVLVVIAAVVTSNLLAAGAMDENHNELRGFEAVAFNRQIATDLAGPVTNERATEEFREFRSFFKAEGEVKDIFSGEGPEADRFNSYMTRNYQYLSTFLRPWMTGGMESAHMTIWRVDVENNVDLYGAIRGALEDRLSQPLKQTWTFSEAEREFWLNSYDATTKPIVYGYGGGWDFFGELYSVVILLFVAVCVGVTPVFSDEYRGRTDAVVLSTRDGKGKLATAKILASLVFTLGVMIVGLALMLGLSLACFGVEGASLPIQALNVMVPYEMTLLQAALIASALAVLIGVGLMAFILFLSAQWKSSLGIFMIAIAVIFLPLFLPLAEHGFLLHISVLMPAIATSYQNLFAALISYPIGSAVIDAQTVIVVFYLVLTALFVPLAARTFARKQVA